MFDHIYFAAACEAKDSGLLSLPRWWEYLRVDSNCDIIFKVPDDIWLVALAILGMLLRLGGLIAVIMVVIAGVKFMSAMGNADQAVSARKGIINAFIGLIIISIATVLVAFLGKAVGN